MFTTSQNAQRHAEKMPERTTRLHCRVLPESASISAASLSRLLGFAECGALVTFEGLVRASEGARQISAIIYEFHPVMAEQELERLCERALAEFEIEQIACEHLTGRVNVQEVSVAIAVGASHRGAAFAACQYVLDQLKQVVPIWKVPVYVESQVGRGAA
jgi:molybdopterin synthase catalytic subunit